MAKAQELPQTSISDAERAADSRADALSAVLLVAIAVLTAIYWISGQ
jgi:hypothetical protein